MSTPNEQPKPQAEKVSPEVVSDINEKLTVAEPPVAEEKKDEASEKEGSLAQKLAEIGEETVAKIKSALADVDKDELKKSLNKDNVKRSLASTLDSFNTKVQSLLATKPEDEDQTAPKHSAAEDKL